jgi:hypothetical protein
MLFLCPYCYCTPKLKVSQGSGRSAYVTGKVVRAAADDVEFCYSNGMNGPKIRKQAYQLTPEDMVRFPVWEFALDEEGAPDQDEATVRPVQSDGPIDPSLGTFLVKASFVLADGTAFVGYVTPSSGAGAADTVDPIILSASGPIFFWCGIIAPTPDEISESYKRLNKNAAAEVFPIRFCADVSLVNGPLSGQVPGFLVMDDTKANGIRILK